MHMDLCGNAYSPSRYVIVDTYMYSAAGWLYVCVCESVSFCDSRRNFSTYGCARQIYRVAARSHIFKIQNHVPHQICLNRLLFYSLISVKSFTLQAK